MSRSYLTHGDRQGLNDLLMCHGNNTLTVYLNDSVPNPNATSLSNATSHQTADLRTWERHFLLKKAKYTAQPSLIKNNSPPFILSLSLKFNVKLHTRAYSRCHSAHWSQAGTWDQVSWWGRWWQEGSSQCSVLPSPDSLDPVRKTSRHSHAEILLQDKFADVFLIVHLSC